MVPACFDVGIAECIQMLMIAYKTFWRYLNHSNNSKTRIVSVYDKSARLSHLHAVSIVSSFFFFFQKKTTTNKSSISLCIFQNPTPSPHGSENVEQQMLAQMNSMIIHCWAIKILTLHQNLYWVNQKKKKGGKCCLYIPSLDFQICITLQLILILLGISVSCILVLAVENVLPQ